MAMLYGKPFQWTYSPENIRAFEERVKVLRNLVAEVTEERNLVTETIKDRIGKAAKPVGHPSSIEGRAGGTRHR